MSLKITFVNPNTEQDMDKYLPKILAEAVINKIIREGNDSDTSENGAVKHSA
jgi:hypothetical protein